MNNKKVPMRMCLMTNEKLPKKELIRIVKTPNGEIVIDDIGKINGHGAYIKKDMEVLNRLIKSKRLNNLFECEIPSSIYEDLKNKIEK